MSHFQTAGTAGTSNESEGTTTTGTYDSHDAVMSHQTFCQRHFRATSRGLLSEYMVACSKYSNEKTACALHQQFVNHIAYMRMLLVTQRTGSGRGVNKGDGSAAGSPVGRGPNSFQESASETSASATGGSASYIIRNDWSRAHCRKLNHAWNQHVQEEVVSAAMEASVAWICGDDEYEHFDDIQPVGEFSCYFGNLGLVAQKWPSEKAAKDFINSLHAAVNAPGSDFYTPLGITCTILGVPLVFQSVAPLTSLHTRWADNPLIHFNMNGLCAGMHFFRTAFPKGLTNGSNASTPAVTAISHTLQAQYATITPAVFTNLHVSVGQDARMYILDARSLTLRGHLAATTQVATLTAASKDTRSTSANSGGGLTSGAASISLGSGWTILGAASRSALELVSGDIGSTKAGSLAGPVPIFYNTVFSDRFPRRECTFSLGGNRNTPYSPQEFVHRFKLRAVSEYLLQSLDDVLKDTILVSSIAHVHGVTYGANIYPIYHTLVEQEALFKNSIASTNQRAPQKSGDLYGGGGKSNATSHTPAARHRLQLFKKARDVVVTDVLARVVKRTIKEEWRRLLVDKGFLRNLRDVLQQEAEDDEDEDERNNGVGSSSAASPYNSSFGGVGSFGKSDSNSEFVAFGAVLHSRGASFASNAKPSTDSDQPSNVAPVVSFRAFERSNGPKVSATDLTNSLNKPLADAINTILASVFTWKGRDSEEDTEGGNINNDGNSNNNRKRGGGREYPVTLKPRMFSELVFIANDAYINKMIIPTGKPGSISFKFEVELEDVRVEHMIGLIEEMLGVDLVVGTDPSSSHPPVYVDPTTNQFEAFFDLNNVDVSPILRSEALFTTIDVPLPLSAGMKSKVAEYATLQQKVAAKLVSLVDVALPVDLVHYCIDTAKHAYLHAGDVRIAHRGHINDVDFSELYQVHTQVPALHSPKSTEMLLCFEAAVAFRRSWFAALTDLPGSLRFLMKFTERTKAILSSAATAAATVVPSSVDSGGGSAGSPTTTTSRQSTASLLKGSSITLANKLKILLKAGERFSTITLSTAIEAAVLDLDGLMEAGVINGNEKKRRGVTGGMGTTPSTKGGFKELTVQHAGYLLLQPLAMLVKYHSQPTIKRNLTESLGIAVKHAGDRRDVIVQMYGEMSVEAGVACNDIAAICSTSKYDFDQAEVEFEKAVSILQQAQPEGPVIFVTINNLAFLYFRKAERLRKSATQAAANNPDEEASNSAVAKGVHVRIADLLQKAENLLNDVVQAEGRLSPLDVAAALNNLASIKLFQEKFWEAKALFDKTLAITEDEVVPDAPELPCRFYAVRNLKVLARKQYLKAVLLVQKCIRRYVERLRKRKAQKALEGITPIQWAGRAFLTRRKIARLYKFSAYYFWMKIPRLYTRKLPVASWTLPVAIREREWEKLLEEKVLLLQRVIRGSDPRRRLGPAVSFVFTHINTRRPALEMEIFRRRFMAFSQFSLLQAERCASFHYTKMATTCYAPGTVLEEAYFRRRILDERDLLASQLIVASEVSRREAFAKEELRARSSADDYYKVDTIEQQERLSRRHIGALQLEGALSCWFNELHHKLFTTHVSSVIQSEHERITFFIRESRLRRRIELQYISAVCGPVVSRAVSSVGRGFMIRRWLRRIQKCQSGESLERDGLLLQQEDSFNRLRKELSRNIRLNHCQAREQEQRRIHLVEAEASRWDTLISRSEVVVLIEECNARSALIATYHASLLSDVMIPEMEYRAIVSHHDTLREGLLGAATIIMGSSTPSTSMVGRDPMIVVHERLAWRALMEQSVKQNLQIRLSAIRGHLMQVPKEEMAARTMVQVYSEPLERCELNHYHRVLVDHCLREVHERSTLKENQLSQKASIDAKEAISRQQRAERLAVETDELGSAPPLPTTTSSSMASRGAIASQEEQEWLHITSSGFYEQHKITIQATMTAHLETLSLTFFQGYHLAESIGMWGSLMTWGEKDRRRAILDQEASESCYGISYNMQRDMKAIIARWMGWAMAYTTGYGPSDTAFVGIHVSELHGLPPSRRFLIDEEVRERVELHAFSQKLLLLHRFTTDERLLSRLHGLEVCMNESMEKVTRDSVLREASIEQLGLLENFAVGSATASIEAPWSREHAYLCQQILLKEEKVWRKHGCVLDEYRGRLRLYYEYVESSARVKIKVDQQVSSYAVGLLMVHSAHVSEHLYTPTLEKLSQHYILIQKELVRYRMWTALDVLGGFAMAGLVRRRMAKLRLWRYQTATTIQNAGRGYLARTRHIHTIAAVMEYLTTLEKAQDIRRHSIILEEQNAREQLAKYLQLTGSKFLRSMRKKSTATIADRQKSRRSVSPLASLLDDNSPAAVVRVLVPSPKLGASPHGRPSMIGSGDTVMSSCELIRPGSFALGGETPPTPTNHNNPDHVRSTSSRIVGSNYPSPLLLDGLPTHVGRKASVVVADGGAASLEYSLPHTAPHQRSLGGDSLTASSSDTPMNIIASPIPAVSTANRPITPTSAPRQPHQRPTSAAPRVPTVTKKVTSAVPSRLYSTPAWASTNMHGVLLGTNKSTTSPTKPSPSSFSQAPLRPQSANATTHITVEEPRAPTTSRPETTWTRPTQSVPLSINQLERHRTNRRRPSSARAPL